MTKYYIHYSFTIIIYNPPLKQTKGRGDESIKNMVNTNYHINYGHKCKRLYNQEGSKNFYK